MSGHSKWSQIKRQKGTNDARKGQVFTKLGREITITAREGGTDPEVNFRLRLAIGRAREQNMPMENIDRAIKRAAGLGEGSQIEEMNYEGYGPGGSAVLVEVATDNRNRAASEVRNAFTRGGGNLGELGCVNWLFDSKGVLAVATDGKDPDELSLVAIDAGAEDVMTEDGAIEIYTDTSSLEAVRRELENRKLKILSADHAKLPKTSLSLEEKDALQLLKLIDRLEELDDVQKVYTNVDFTDDQLEKYEG